MTRIESQKVVISKPAEQVFEFFSSFDNYKELMPSSVSKFTSTADTCEIGIKNMGSLPMKIVKRDNGKSILAEKNGDAMFNFTFEANVVALSETSSEIQLILNADLNPMLKMVAAKPLAGFLDILLNRYKDSL
ncbi:MAG: hypothetical protein RIS47_292 [Bacteroidota bacterium]|jgi:carbon monoxide dehydrogenase subunit G